MNLLGILIFLILILGCQKNMNTLKIDILNAPIANSINLKKLDGRNIVTTIQYQLLINLNLTLLEYDKNANLVTLLAENFDVIDNQIILEIKKGVKTISGHEITARDAELSLKRLMHSKSGSHSRLEDLICLKSSQKSDRCSGISSEGYLLKITAIKKSYVPFILSLLTNADNVIFPVTAIDQESDELPILNFRETTGPYFIDADEIHEGELEKLKLKLNKGHFLSTGNIPQEIHYTVENKMDLIDDDGKLNKKFNYISNTYSVTSESVKTWKDKDNSIEIYPTAQLKNTMIFSTELGRKNLASKDLVAWQLFIRDHLLGPGSNLLSVEREQLGYFSNGSDGQLSSEQLESVKKFYHYTVKNTEALKRKIKVGVFPSVFEGYRKEFSKITNLELIQLKEFPGKENKPNVDLFIATIDSSFRESLDLLQYNKTFGIFNVTDDEMQNYINAESKEYRIKLLQDTHFRSLMEGRFVNIGTAPYYTILSKEWTAEPSKLFVGFPVWKIRRKN